MPTQAQKSEIEARLEPVHIKPPDLEPAELPTDAELKEAVEKQANETEDTPEKKAKARQDDPRAQREYTFPINYMDASGKAWMGEFTTKILSVHERQRVGILRAQLSGGMPVESLDALTSELNLIVSHLTYSLTERPKWAETLRNIDDFAILQAIYGEVASHEAFFLGWEKN